jgi:hypothetical protein
MGLHGLLQGSGIALPFTFYVSQVFKLDVCVELVVLHYEAVRDNPKFNYRLITTSFMTSFVCVNTNWKLKFLILGGLNVLFAKYNYNDQVNEDEMGRVCRTHDKRNT